MSICHLCGARTVVGLLDFGEQPICSRFLTDSAGAEYRHPLALGQCKSCGLIQIRFPAPTGELAPRFDWITYNEPEEHLDELVEIVSSLPGVTLRSTVTGISAKDDSTLLRFREKGFARARRLDAELDLGIHNSRSGVETIAACLTCATAKDLVRKHGVSDVVIARHILEHACNLREFTAALQELVAPDGYVVVEVPDCGRALESLDYTTIWEEHVSYFTLSMFRQWLDESGFSPVRLECYAYALENSLVAIAHLRHRDKAVCRRMGRQKVESERSRALSFSEGFSEQRSRARRYLGRYRRRLGGIALFGAGHLACTFVNLLGLGEYMEFVADDDPNKRGLFMPGSRLPICRSDALVEKSIKLCLLSVNPLSEDKVIQRNRNFLDVGGNFFSIFPASRRALPSLS